MKYEEQDRGNTEKYMRYMKGMDSVVVEKVASASAFFVDRPEHCIVDVGMASGMSSYILAHLFPQTKIIGVDVNPKMVKIAQAKYKHPNLSFIVDDGEKLEKLNKDTITGFFNCSSIHHITSFNNYNPQKAFTTLKRQSELLCEGGVIVVRDFVKPPDKEILIEFPDDEQGEFNAKLLNVFSMEARSLSPEAEKGFPIKRLSQKGKKHIFKLYYADALEFIRRKDYLDDWKVEIQEEYAYFSQNDFEQVFSDLGLRTIVSYPVYNSWIIKNRYAGRFKIFNLEGKDLGIPPTNYVIAGEKVINRGTRLKSVRHLPISKDSFLKKSSFKNTEDNKIWDLIERPGDVIDVIPYYIDEKGNLKIIAKHGYPRPIVTRTENILDGKTYSGYVTEGITAMVKNQEDMNTAKSALSERSGIPMNDIIELDFSFSYYTSPGGINEKVRSVFALIKPQKQKVRKSLGNFSGFSDSGEIHEFDALQLIKSAQVGALPDARLELNIYGLIHKLSMLPGIWINETIPIKFKVSEFKESDFIENSEIKNVFTVSENENGFLAHKRTKFYEYGIENSNAIFEYVEPADVSSNTVVTQPVIFHGNKLFLGLEKRELPAPQIKEKNSSILTSPATRLPFHVKSINDLHLFISNLKIYNCKIIRFYKIGEKYMPCMGVTPEQVYPFIVELDKPSDNLVWISLDNLMKNSLKIRDGHLLICLYRLNHFFHTEQL